LHSAQQYNIGGKTSKTLWHVKHIIYSFSSH